MPHYAKQEAPRTGNASSATRASRSAARAALRETTRGGGTACMSRTAHLSEKTRSGTRGKMPDTQLDPQKCQPQATMHCGTADIVNAELLNMPAEL